MQKGKNLQEINKIEGKEERKDSMNWTNKNIGEESEIKFREGKTKKGIFKIEKK